MRVHYSVNFMCSYTRLHRVARAKNALIDLHLLVHYTVQACVAARFLLTYKD